MTAANRDGSSATHPVIRIAEVRSEYTSARLICANLEHRVTGSRYERAPGYLPPEIDYLTADGAFVTIQVRDYDVRLLDRVGAAEAVDHVGRIHLARQGDAPSSGALDRITRDLHPVIAPRFFKSDLIENDYVVPYTTERQYTETQISDKGSVLLQLTRQGFATPDFNVLAAGVYTLSADDRRTCVHAAIHNLEKLSGRRLGDPANPLLIAMRSAMPDYLPGFMPTYLNVGLTPSMLPGLPQRYGADAVARMRLSSRRTILEVLDPARSRTFEERIDPGLSRAENDTLADEIEAVIAAADPHLLDDPYHQIEFFLASIYAYYDDHFDALRNFMGNEILHPAVILQRMVCSVIDEESYAGVLYSRHPRLGTGVHLQYARAIYGEDLMTGRLIPEEVHLNDPEEAREAFPAVYHFWRRLPQLEQIFAAPVMVEFTGVHGTFTILQVNRAQLSGVGMLTAVMDLFRAGEIDSRRVRELIEPFHIRQLESDAIDPASLQRLTPFCRGISVLPRTAVTGRVYFSGQRIEETRRERGGDHAILVKARFTPTDTITMQSVDGIASLSPAAIHVVTTAQTLGIPSLLDLEQDGVRLGPDGRSLHNRDGLVLEEGDWVTISSKNKQLYRGKAVFATARLLRYMDGGTVDLRPEERATFARLATYYRQYHAVLDSIEASEFESLHDLGQSMRSGKLRGQTEQAAEFADRCFDANEQQLVAHLFDTTLGMHLNNLTAFRALSTDRQARLLGAAVRRARNEGRHGYTAGAFIIGCLVDPAAPAALWQQLPPGEIAQLLDEWLLHQKYQAVLSDVGERKLSRAKDTILAEGLDPLRLHVGLVKEFMPLKLSTVDLDEVRRLLPDSADPQTVAVIDLLREPYGAFFDFTRPAEVARLQRLCTALDRPLPGPDDR